VRPNIALLRVFSSGEGWAGMTISVRTRRDRDGRRAETLDAYAAAWTAIAEPRSLGLSRALTDLETAILNEDPRLDAP
jgi:hypothetical protein